MSVDLRIATFNLENLDWARAHEDEFARRLNALRPVLARLDADILCLQEIDAQRRHKHGEREFLALDFLLAQGPYADYARATTTRPGSAQPADVHNLAILSRWPFLTRRQIHHDFVEKWRWTPPGEGELLEPVEIAFDRPLLYVCAAPPDGPPLHVLNLHLRAPRPALVPISEPNRALAEGQFLAAQKREGQALEARLFVETLFDADPEARIAVCGDFNADAFETPTRILRGEGERALEPLESRVAAERRYSVLHDGRPVMLDHILASRALGGECRDVAILNQDLQDEVLAQGPIEGSLHAAVVARFGGTG